MKLATITPFQALEKTLRRQRPTSDEIAKFKEQSTSFLKKIDAYAKQPEKEEHVKTDIRDFLCGTYYKQSVVNIKDNIDLVIHTGKDIASPVGVIIETKRVSNTTEMISEEQPNCKALWEIILYYLEERIRKKNNNIKYCIITDAFNWYIFPSENFEKNFVNKPSFLKEYNDWKAGQKSNSNNNLFYNEIVKPYLDDAIDMELKCVKFNIKDYSKKLSTELESTEEKEQKDLYYLMKLLSPQNLLKEPIAVDSNYLNKDFYKELLYVIGLEEVKDGGKLLIRRCPEGKRQSGSLIENTCYVLSTRGELINDELYEIALELCLTWLNRILFLKLLEGQLVAWRGKENKFLNSSFIQGYDELYKLFHAVLAVPINDRNADFKEKYAQIPYLNSSLFEVSSIEKKYIPVNSLDDSAVIEIPTWSILKKSTNNINGLNSLGYLLRFLDSYDFASEGEKDVKKNEKKTIINASVLGKVYEKINGYKEGSVFTPDVITMYMCRESIRLAVLEKFKIETGKNLQDFTDLYNVIDSITLKKANEIVNSLRICDPAVGSGHFLVSALNEIIAIKAELGILTDRNGKKIKPSEYEIVVENDELIIYEDGSEQVFNYIPGNTESQRIQETIFYEKQNIIENCLFGVDINPKSVQICRLRLWIELLKSAYYRQESNTELETLPNIDINIKCGNSLISRWTLDIKLGEALKKAKISVTDYRQQVSNYKTTKSKKDKIELTKNIEKIKSSFKTELAANDPLLHQRNVLDGKLFNLTQQLELIPISQSEKTKKITELTKKIASVKGQIVQIESNVIYKDAFEWRFEFPEVLTDDGSFAGFDIIIGNPPYVSTKGRKKEDQVILEHEYGFSDDLYYHFVIQGFNLLRSGGINTMITPDTYFTTLTKTSLRKELLKNTFISIAHLGHDVFDSAMVSTSIFISQKKPFKNEKFNVIDVHGTRSIAGALKYEFTQNEYAQSINGSFFVPNRMNLEIHKNIAPIHTELVSEWWDKISTSKTISKNKSILDNYRNSLKPGDWTLLGCVIDGGVGLQTGNNGKYIGVKTNSKEAVRIRLSRIMKLKEVNEKQKISIEMPSSEENIWKLFEFIKGQYGRDVFGQGYLYKIVPDNMIASVDLISEDEKKHGISDIRSFVPYDKGDKDGNRWYLETPYLINWSKENVDFLKTDKKARYQGYQFYFMEGFCWNNNLNENYSDIKCKIKMKGVSDVASMSLYAMTDCVPDYYIVSMINSKLLGQIYRSFLNATVNVQMNDIKALPLIIPTKEQLFNCKILFDLAVAIQKEFFANEISKKIQEQKLQDVQEQIDCFVYNLYGLTEKEIKIVESETLK